MTTLEQRQALKDAAEKALHTRSTGVSDAGYAIYMRIIGQFTHLVTEETILSLLAEFDFEQDRAVKAELNHINACENINDLEKEISGLKSTIEEAEKAVPKWISVKDEWPEHSENVLVLDISGDIHIGYLEIEKPSYEDSFKPYLYWEVRGVDDFDFPRLTHWQRLPTPPVEGVAEARLKELDEELNKSLSTFGTEDVTNIPQEVLGAAREAIAKGKK